jgi:hypothetical protein
MIYLVTVTRTQQWYDLTDVALKRLISLGIAQIQGSFGYFVQSTKPVGVVVLTDLAQMPDQIVKTIMVV